MYTRFQSRLQIFASLPNLWAFAMEHWKIKVSNMGPHIREWSSATVGVQNVLLVDGHTTADVDATVWWPGRWSRGQTAATPQSDAPYTLRLSMSWIRVNEKRAPPGNVPGTPDRGLECWAATAAGYEAECLLGQLLRLRSCVREQEEHFEHRI